MMFCLISNIAFWVFLGWWWFRGRKVAVEVNRVDRSDHIVAAIREKSGSLSS
jgi:hypothetical protein